MRKRKIFSLLLSTVLALDSLPLSVFAMEQECSHANPEESCEICVEEIQELIDTLPAMENINDENRSDVIVLMESIDARKWKLDDETRAKLDTDKYADAAFVLGTPANYFGFALGKRYEASASETPMASFAFLNESGEAETVLTAEGIAVTSLTPTPNGEELRGYLPAGTYTLSELVEGEWNLSLSVNNIDDDDHTFTGVSGDLLELVAVNSYVCEHSAGDLGYSEVLEETHSFQCSKCYDIISVPHEFDATGKCICDKMAIASVTANGVTTYYGSMYEATSEIESCTAADNAELKLLDNYDQYISISGGVFTLNLNNKTVHVEREQSCALEMMDGTVTVTGGTLSSSRRAVDIWGGTLNIVDAVITTTTVHAASRTLDVKSGSTLNVYSGTITGKVMGIEVSGGTVNIFGGVVHSEGSRQSGAVYIEDGVVNISGGNFYNGSKYNSGALYVANGVANITGGAFDSVKFDIICEGTANIRLNLPQNGTIGASFPGGIKVDGVALKDLLAPEAAYWQGDTMIIPTDDADEIVGGDVTIRTACKHDSLTSSSNGNVISANCSKCNVSSTATLIAEGKTYDGTAVTAIVEKTGILANENISITYSMNGEVINESAIQAGTYTASMTIEGQTASTDFTIVQKELTPSISGSVTKVYDGTTEIPSENDLSIELTGLVGSDDVKATATFAYAGKDVGTTKINASDITLHGTDISNYKLNSTTVSANVGEITPKVITATVKTNNVNAYVGDVVPVPSWTVSESGLVAGDELIKEMKIQYKQGETLSDTPDMSKPGTYNIVITEFTVNPNYSDENITVSEELGTLTIKVKPMVDTPSYGDDSDDEEESKQETIKVPVSGDKTSTKTEASVSGSAVAIETPSEKKLDQIIDNPNDDGSIEIDLSGLDDKVEKVNLPLKLIEKVAEEAAKPNSKLDSLKIKLPGGAVVLDSKTLQTIAEEAECNTIRLVLDKVGNKHLNEKQKNALNGKTVYGVYEAYLYCVKGNERISDFEGGEATLSVPFNVPAGKSAENFSVWYISANGNMTRLPTWFEGKNICWSVGHFSDFVILYDANSIVKFNPETGEADLVDVAVAFAFASIISAVMISKKK